MAKFNAAFWKWFGKSKVVDENGQPMVVYHWTDAKFTVFAPHPITLRDNEEPYFNFSPKPEYFAGFATRRYRLAVYLSIQKIKVLPGLTVDAMGAGIESALITKLKAQGYDGVISKERHHIIVFSPHQIKLASNRGTWSRTDPDIRRNPKFGRCFVDAYMAVLTDARVGPKNAPLSSFDEVSIVHGTARVADAKTGKPKAGPHAWVEFRAGKFWFVYDPANNLLAGRDTYYEDYAATPSQKYSKAEVTKLRKVHKHCGPFSSGGS